MGLSDVLPKLKGENKAPPPPPSPSCNVVSLFELPVEHNKHPYFEWRGGEGRGWIGFFSEVTLFECICFLGKLYGYNVSTILSPIVGNL